jgi:hypothetical protein
MNRQRVAQGAFKYLMMIAVALTGTFGAFVFGERPTAVAVTKAKAKRRPAQLDPAAKPHVLPLECWDKLTQVKVPPGTKWVRITGKVCGGAVGLDEIQISNQTNHFEATIFPLGDGLTTDLVPLHEGLNQLTFTIAHEGGPSLGHLDLTR